MRRSVYIPGTLGCWKDSEIPVGPSLLGGP